MSIDFRALIPDPRSDASALRAFVAVARLGTVGGAAEALGRAQPSVSARIASLEDAWGTRLFRREARGMALTPEGASLLPGAEAALRALEELDRRAGLPVSPSGLVRVGAGDALGRIVLPRALGRLVEERPGLKVRLLEGSGRRLLEALTTGRIDVALVVRPAGTAFPESVEATVLLETAVDLLLPPGLRPRPRTLPLDFLRDRPLVSLQAESGFRRHVEAALAGSHIAFRPTVEVGNLSLVRRFVSAGLGVAPVPAIAFGRGAPGPPVERRRLGGVPPVGYCRAVRSGVPLPDAALRLIELLQP